MIKLVQYSKGKYTYIVLHKKQMATNLIMRYCFPTKPKLAQSRN